MLNSTHYFVTEISNRRELQETAYNHLSDIKFPAFMNLYKTSTAKSYSFSDNYLRFRNNLLETIQNLIMTTDDKIKDKKLHYKINRAAAKMSAISSGKIDKYEYFMDEEILLSDQSRTIERARFTYSPLRKAFEKQTKTIEEQGKNK